MFNTGGFEGRPPVAHPERSLFEVVAVVAGEDESAVDPSRVTVERLVQLPRNGTRRR